MPTFSEGPLVTGCHIKLHTNALKVAVQRFVKLLHFLRGGIGGMGIEFLEHSTDGILYQFLFIDAIDIKIGDGHLGILQFP